jgi:DNA polymerase-1
MQGSAADIIKKAMIAVDQWIDAQKDEIKMIMQVHDELVFELPEGCAARVSKHIQSLMSSAAELAVPLVVDCGIGHNWDEAH